MIFRTKQNTVKTKWGDLGSPNLQFPRNPKHTEPGAADMFFCPNRRNRIQQRTKQFPYPQLTSIHLFPPAALHIIFKKSPFQEVFPGLWKTTLGRKGWLLRTVSGKTMFFICYQSPQRKQDDGNNTFALTCLKGHMGQTTPSVVSRSHGHPWSPWYKAHSQDRVWVLNVQRGGFRKRRCHLNSILVWPQASSRR